MKILIRIIVIAMILGLIYISLFYPKETKNYFVSRKVRNVEFFKMLEIPNFLKEIIFIIGDFQELLCTTCPYVLIIPAFIILLNNSLLINIILHILFFFFVVFHIPTNCLGRLTTFINLYNVRNIINFAIIVVAIAISTTKLEIKKVAKSIVSPKKEIMKVIK